MTISAILCPDFVHISAYFRSQLNKLLRDIDAVEEIKEHALCNFEFVSFFTLFYDFHFIKLCRIFFMCQLLKTGQILNVSLCYYVSEISLLHCKSGFQKAWFTLHKYGII